MVVNGLVLCDCEEPQQENKDLVLDTDDSDTETLSLCDLPLDSDWKDHCYSSSEQDQSTSFDHHQDLFEFFTHQFSDTRTHQSHKDDILFCGKLIAFKESEAPIKAHDSLVKDIEPESTKKMGSWTTKQKYCFEDVPYREERGVDFSMKKVSVLASPMRSRWYLFAFGVGRFPTEMKLMDMKTRQKKKKQASGCASNESSPLVKSDNRGKSSNSDNRNSSREKKGWSMLDILGCRYQRDNVVEKASIGCIRSVRIDINRGNECLG